MQYVLILKTFILSCMLYFKGENLLRPTDDIELELVRVCRLLL
jgi:hypothetical protein